MSAFSHALTNIVETNYANQAEFASKTKVSQAMISRYMAGDYRPDKSTLEKICTALPIEQRQALAEAHLQDELPPSCRNQITIKAFTTRIREDQPLPEEILKLDNKTKKAVLFLAKLALEDKDAQASLQSTARLLGCKI